MEFSGRPFNTLVLLFVASTLLAVGLGTTGRCFAEPSATGGPFG